jgi:protein TonB
VDLDFTIAEDGSVKDITVMGSEPPGVFEEAATKAIAQWKYRPVVRNGRPAEQRARLRLRFDVADNE